MVYALHKFINFLLGKKFVLYVNHVALVYLVNKPQVSGRITRWLLLFLEYEFTIVYKPSRTHVIVDVLSKLLTKLVNEKRTYCNEHMSIVLFSHITVYKVATCCTPYQLIYVLHPPMQKEDVLPSISGDHIDVKPTKVLTSIITKLEKVTRE
jgi:hypothetical protein